MVLQIQQKLLSYCLFHKDLEMEGGIFGHPDTAEKQLPANTSESCWEL